MRVKEKGKIMETAHRKGSDKKDEVGMIEGGKARAKMPAKPPKKEKYKK